MFNFTKHLRNPKSIFLVVTILFLIIKSVGAQIRVMPLGDRVVLGTGSAPNNVGGFRDDLYLMLNSNTIPFNFVGSLNDGFSFDPNHEGHPGTTVLAINQSLPNYLQQFRPHIVIIHLGTEELIQTGNATSIINDLTITVNTISNYSAETEIYMSTLIPNGDFGVNINIDQLNTQIKQLVATQQAFGKNIRLVDLNEAFSSNGSWSIDYMSSNDFPNDLGYSIMSNNFFDIISNNSTYFDLETFTDDFNGRVNLGPNWSTNASFEIQSNEMTNTSIQSTWDNMIASANSVVNPNTIEFRFSSTNSDLAGIAESGIVILLDSASVSSNGYLVTMNSDKLRLFSLNQGLIGSNIDNLDIGATFPQPGERLKVFVEKDGQGYHFSAYIENNLVGTVSHETGTNPNQIHFGGIILKGALNNNIDDFYISNMVDETAPAPINDLAVVRTSAAVAQLQWTASGDDGSVRTATSYDLRYATFIIDATNFDFAEQAEVILEPSLAQTLEKVYVSGLKSNTQYYFAVKVIDDNNNYSDISNVDQSTLPNSVYFLEDFERTEIGQQWSVASGVEIFNGNLVTIQAGDAWNSHAVLSSPSNAFEVGFQWAADMAPDQVENAALLFKLDLDAPQSNGYMVEWVATSKQFKLWSIIQGNPTDQLDVLPVQSQNIIPGDFLKVYYYSNGINSTFAIFVNDVYLGELVDSNNIFGNNDPYYVGILLHGNSSIAVENFFQYSPVLQPSQLQYFSGNAQVDTVGQILDQPLEVQVLDAGNNPVYFGNVHFEVESGNAKLFPPSFPDGRIYIEAEDGNPIAPMEIVADTNASGDAFIVTPASGGDGGSISVKFYVTTTGNYSVWGRTIAPSGTEDSFIIQVDNEPEITWDVVNSFDWIWDTVSDRGSGTTTQPEFNPYFVNLTEGFHTVIIKRRDPGTKLDKLIFTKNSLFTPFGKEELNIYPSDFSGISRAFLRLGGQSSQIQVKAWIDELPGQVVNFQVQSVGAIAYKIVYISGNDQFGTAGNPLLQPFVTKVTDEFDNPVMNFSVNFVVTQGNGQVSQTQPVLTDQNGIASTLLTMATDVPENKVEAGANGLVGSPLEFVANASAGFPTKIEYVSGNNQVGGVGAPLANPMVVKVIDNSNNPIPGFTVQFENRSQNGGNLGATNVVTNGIGEASVGFTFGIIMGAYQIAAIGAGLQNSPIIFDFTAGPGPAVQMVKVSGDSALGVSDYPLVEPFVVQMFDQFGNASNGQTVTFKVIEGGGHFQGAGTEISVNTDASGLANAILIMGPITGNYNNKVMVEKTGVQGSPIIFVATALPPTASHLTLFDGNDQVGVINKGLTNPLQVKVANAAGEPAKNHPVVFHVIAGGGIFTGSLDTVQTVATNENGVASATLRCGPNPGQDVNVINVTSIVGSTPLIGSPVWFNASARYPGVKITVVRGNNQSGLVGAQLSDPLEVKIVDDQDQPVSGQQVEFLLKSKIGKLDGGSDTLIVKQTNVTGKTSVTLTLGTESGLNNHIVQVSANDGFQVLQNSPITFLASASQTNSVNLIRISSAAQTGTVGKKVASPISVKVTDQFNQGVANQEVVFEIISGDGSVGPLNESSYKVQTSVDGFAQVDWILGIKSGQSNNKLLASASNGINELNGSPLEFTASAQADVTDPNISTITATSPVVANGQDKSTITIYLKDKFKNPIVGKGVVLTASGDYAFLQQPATVTNDSGKTVGHLTSIRSGDKLVYARNSSDNVLLINFATVEFSASAASRVFVTAGNSQRRNIGTALANPMVVTVTDDFDNPIPNHPITFKAKTSNGYILDNQPVLTDSFGLASASYVLSDNPGSNVIHADAGNLTGSPAIFTAIGEENPAYRVVYRSGNNQTGVAGQQLAESVSVRVMDQSDNPVKNVDINFSVTFGGGNVVNSQPVETNAYGVANSTVIVGNQAGTNLIAASSLGLIGSPFTFVANVIPGGAAQLQIVSGDNQNVNLQSQSQPMTVCVMDDFDNPVPGVSVLYEVVSGFATIATSQPVASNSQGQASATILAQTTSGEIIVKASLSSNPVVHEYFTLNVLPSNPNNLSIYGSDQMIVTKGNLSAHPVRALFVDQYNNPVPNVTVNFVVSSGDAGIFGANQKSTESDGIAKCYILPGANATAIQVLATSSSDPGKILTYTLTAVDNNVPVLENLVGRDIQEAQSVKFQVVASDADGDSLSLSVLGKPEGANVRFVSQEKWEFSWTPSYYQSGSYILVFSAYDAKGGADRDTITINVANVNRKPVISYFYPPKDTSLVPGNGITFDVNAYDPDEEQISTLWYKNGSFETNSKMYEYKSDPTFTGAEYISALVTDGQDTVKKNWVISVKTAVEMADLTANVNDQQSGIEIQWHTRKETDNLGFEVWRSNRKEGLYKPIHMELIPPNEYGEYTFFDDSVEAGINYYYKVVDKNIGGAKMQHGPVQAMISLPAFYQLEQSYPNPFALNLGHAKTVIKFQIPTRDLVKIRIFNVLGRQVRVLQEKHFAPGYHQIQWDGRDQSGKIVTSGIYYYEFRSGEFKAIKRMVLIR